MLRSFPFIFCFITIVLAVTGQAPSNREKAISDKIQTAKLHMYEGKLALSERELLNILENDKPVPPGCFDKACFILSMINRYQGNYDKALYYSQECVKNAEKTNDTVATDYFYGELALVCKELGQTDKCIGYFQKALEIRKNKKSETYIIYRTAGFLIDQLLRKKEEKEAFGIIAGLEKDNPPATAFERAILFQVKANYFNRLQQYELADRYYQAMIASKGFVHEKSEIASIAFQDVGEFYLERKEYVKASEYLIKSLDVDEGGTTASRIKDIHFLLFKVDSSIGDYLSSINHLNVYLRIKDSLFNETKSRQIEELGIRYEADKKEQSIQLLEKENAFQQNKLHQARITRNWIFGGIVLMIIITGLVINYSRLKQKTNRKLEIQQKEISMQNNSLQHLVTEKEWLVKEIHHRVKNNFHMVIALLGTQLKYLKTGEAIRAITDSQHRVHAMSLVHQKLYQSENLSAVNMADYMHDLINYLRDMFHVNQPIQFNVDVDAIELNLTHCIPLGLIVNEAITNSIKYAFANGREGAVNVSFKQVSRECFVLKISDNGIGLPEDFDIQKPDSMGIRLIRGLSDDIEARLSITGVAGTEIVVWFSYDPMVSSYPDINTSQLTTAI